MAGTKVSVLTAGAALGGTEAIPAVQSAATVKITAAQIKTFTSASPTLVTPVLGVATGTSLALGGATIGSNALAVTGTANISGDLRTTGFVYISGGAENRLLFGSSVDTSLSKVSAGVIGVGTGTQGSVAGKLQASEYRLTNSEAIYPRTTNSITMYVGADIAEFIAAGTASGMQFGSTRALNWSSGAVGATSDLFLTRAAAATLQHGAADAASPIAQTIKFQDVVAGTSNTAGVNATIQAPAGTGTGAGGSLIFQVAPAGSAGSNKNAWTNALTIYSSGVAAVSNGLIIGANAVFSWSGKTGLNSGADGSLTVSTNNGTTGAFTITAGASNLATFNGGVIATSFTAITTVQAGSNVIAASNGSFTFNMGSPPALYAGGAGILEQRNGVNAQRHDIFNTYTDASNNERGYIGFVGNKFVVGNAKAGTGTNRHTRIESLSGVLELADGNSDVIITGGAFLIGTRALYFGNAADLILSRPAAATLQFGAADSATPIAQVIKFQDVIAGTTNTAGVNATIQAPAGTGTGAGGSLIFQVAPAGSTGSAKNAWATAWQINSAGHLLAGADNAYDIGASGANRPRNLYVANTIIGTAFVGNAANGFNFSSRGFIVAPANGVFKLSDQADADFSRLQFGGTTSSFPALKRSTTSLQARLADDSAFTNIQGKLTTDTAYTAGDPTTTGYLVVYDSTGTAYRVPALLN